MSRNSIQSKVILGFTTLTIITIALVSYILLITEQSLEITRGKALTSSLNESLKSIERSTDNYLSNAARDYESYFRDLDVYYKVLVSDIKFVTEKVEGLDAVDRTVNSLSDGFGVAINKQRVSELTQSIFHAQKGWGVFSKNLDQQFGDNKQEPRLEWGAKFIQENVPALIAEFQSIENQIESLAQRQARASRVLGRTTVVLVAAFTLLFAIWFYQKIIRPLVNTEKAFQRVADGEFGHQIEVKSNDEIGRLTTAFNSLSARSQLVLNIIDQLQGTKTDAQLIDNLFEQSSDYFKSDAVLFAEFHGDFKEVRFPEVAPVRYLKNIHQLQVADSKQDRYFENVFSKGLVTNIDNLPSVEGSLLVREIIKRYPLKSALVVPLVSEHVNRVLIFASYHESLFTQAQVELLTQLQTILQHRFSTEQYSELE